MASQSVSDSMHKITEKISSLFVSHVSPNRNHSKQIVGKVVGLVYDERMMAHEEPEGDHPEQPARISSIFDRLTRLGLAERCLRIAAREATDEELTGVHTSQHVAVMRHLSSRLSQSELEDLAMMYNSIYFNGGSSSAALLAAGSLVELALTVARGDIHSGAAVIRPPGHHAESNAAMGFCLFNNVAVAAHVLLKQQPSLGIRKILIVDWDVHHGNGIQHMFWDDPTVLYFSVHRYQGGAFYPAGPDGDFDQLGGSNALGFNLNVPWPGGGFGDADYLAVWDHVLMPAGREFDPDIVLISAGFDAAMGDPLGGCCLTPFGYSQMTHKLRELANGRLVLALEGGYNLESISSSYAACVAAMLGDVPISRYPEGHPTVPSEEAVETIAKVRTALASHWSSIGSNPTTHFPIKILNSAYPITSKGVGKNALTPAAVAPDFISPPESPSLDATYVWYASYGSNMLEERFLCYIRGGKVDGMQFPCVGCSDPTLPVKSKWIAVNRKMWFGRKKTATWGVGGVSFLDLHESEDATCHVRIYKITIDQFNDVIAQENKKSNLLLTQSRFQLQQLDTLRSSTSSPCLELLPDAWYGTILYLGEDEGSPILTFTCSPSDVSKFATGELPKNPPSSSYARVIKKALTSELGLENEAADIYILERSS